MFQVCHHLFLYQIQPKTVHLISTNCLDLDSLHWKHFKSMTMLKNQHYSKMISLPGCIGKYIRIKCSLATNNCKIIEREGDKVPYQCAKRVFFPLIAFRKSFLWYLLWAKDFGNSLCAKMWYFSAKIWYFRWFSKALKTKNSITLAYIIKWRLRHDPI